MTINQHSQYKNPETEAIYFTPVSFLLLLHVKISLTLLENGLFNSAKCKYIVCDHSDHSDVEESLQDSGLSFRIWFIREVGKR